jgi:hypothetical protein
MNAEHFLSRWARRKAQVAREQERTDNVTEQSSDVAAAPPPTLEEIAALTPQSDFRRFVAPGIDPHVRRAALKKLFSDPHFSAMDGLDVYIDDYNKFTPLPAAMLAALNHVQGLLQPQVRPEDEQERTADVAGDDRPPPDTLALKASSSGAAKDSKAVSSVTDPGRPDHGDPIQNM